MYIFPLTDALLLCPVNGDHLANNLAVPHVHSNRPGSSTRNGCNSIGPFESPATLELRTTIPTTTTSCCKPAATVGPARGSPCTPHLEERVVHHRAALSSRFDTLLLVASLDKKSQASTETLKPRLDKQGENRRRLMVGASSILGRPLVDLQITVGGGSSYWAVPYYGMLVLNPALR